MITNLNGITIVYNEYTGDWTITDYGQYDDAPKTIQEQADYMLEFHDDICAHVDRLCRENAAEVAKDDACAKADYINDIRRDF